MTRGGQNLNFAIPACHVMSLLAQCEGGAPLTGRNPSTDTKTRRRRPLSWPAPPRWRGRVGLCYSSRAKPGPSHYSATSPANR
jgi:hypothetical protein